MTRRRSAVLACAAAALAALAPLPGARAAGWRAPELIPLAVAQTPWVRVDASGDVLAVWTDNGGNTRAALRPSAGALPPAQVAATAMVPIGPPAFDVAGDAFLAVRDTSNRLHLARLPRGAESWTLLGAVGSGVTGASLAVAPEGTAYVLSTEGSGMLLRAWAPDATTPTSVAAPAASATAALHQPLLGADSGGHLVAAWWDDAYDNGTDTDTVTAWTSRRTGAGPWDPPAALSTRQQVRSDGAITFDLAPFAESIAGSSLISWVERAETYATNAVTTAARAAYAVAGGAFETAATLDTRTHTIAADEQIDGTAAAFDGERGVVGWFGRVQGAGPADLRAAFRPAGSGQAFASPQDVVRGTEQVGSLALVGRGGTGPLVAAGTTGSVLTGLGPPGGPLPAATPLLSDQPAPSVVDATAFGADALVLGATGGANPAMRLWIYDATAPRVSGVTVPDSGTAGQPIAVSAAATDTWQAVAPSWDFGDGGGADGSTASHVYGAAGAYTVRATARDASDNVAAPVERAILIAPAPSASPPVPIVHPGLTNATFATVAFNRFLARAKRDGTFGSIDLLCASQGGCTVRVTIARAGGVRAARTAPLTTMRTRVAGGHQTRLALRLSAAGRRALRKAKRLRLRVVIALSDADGHARTVTRTATVRAPRR